MALTQSVAAIVAAVLTLIPQPAEAKSDWLHTGQMPTDSEVIQKMQAEEAAKRTAEVAQEAAAQQSEQAPAVAPPATRAPSPSISHDVWYRLATCESGNGRASANQFQFIDSTWRSLGMSGSPGNAPYSVQLEAAKRLQARSGWGQWPACSRKLGLR